MSVVLSLQVDMWSDIDTQGEAVDAKKIHV